MGRFRRGESIVLRELLRGKVWVARPATVVEDADHLMMFSVPPGATWYGPAAKQDEWIQLKAPGAEWTLQERPWMNTHVLSFAWPGAGAAVLHFWDERWVPRSWYVNVEIPLRRFELGFDTFDQDLDIVVAPDRSSWRWKDEDVVAEGIRIGAYTERDASAFRREAEHALRRLLEWEPPFDREWADWRPDPSWPVPTIPEGWDHVGRSPSAFG